MPCTFLAYADVLAHEWPQVMREIAEVVPIGADGLTILGTDATENFHLAMGPRAGAAHGTQKRAAKACKLADAAMQLIHRPPPGGGKQVAWRLCRNVITIPWITTVAF